MEKEDLEIPEKFKKLVEEIEKLTALDLAELVKILEKKFGVSAQPQIVSAPVQVTQTAPAPQEEKTVFNIVLTSVGEKKIEVIKVVRDVTGKGLKESKDLVDAKVTLGKFSFSEISYLTRALLLNLQF